DFKIINFFREVKVKIINLSDIKGLNNNDIFNINTIKDLQYLRNSVKNTSRGKRSRKILATDAQRH
ncbi:MAG: hypothetical protein V1709_10195, partial [Planctomycetota bacterium]